MKSEEKSAEERLESEMSGDYSDADREVDLRLPLEVDMQPDKLREVGPAYTGPLIRTGPSRNGLDMGCRCLSIWSYVDSCRGLQRKWQGLERAVLGREWPIRHIRANADRGLGLRRPLTFISEKLRDCRARMGSCGRWGHSLSRTHLGLICREKLTRTIGLDCRLATMCRTQSGLPTQCLWDDATAALQLISYLEGIALNVAFLVPETRGATRVGLVGALTAHHGSPGRLADYRRQFEKTTRKTEKDPSIFAIALERPAVNAFGDMGHTA